MESMTNNDAPKHLKTLGFVMEDGGAAKQALPDFFGDVFCPYCKKRLYIPDNNVLILTQGGDEDMRVFVHRDCLVSMANEIVKMGDKIPVKRG